MVRSELCEVVGVTSRSEELATKFASEFGLQRTYPDLQSMLDDSNIEAVYISTPNSMHVEQAYMSACAGKHVLCEKPIGLNTEEVSQLQEIQSHAGVQISEAFMVRYHPRWIAARELIRTGKLGEVRQIHATYSVMVPDRSDIRFQSDLGGGALNDVGVYPITAARYLFEIEPITAFGTFVTNGNEGVDLSVAGLIEFPGDRQLLFSGSLRQAWSHWIVVIGSEGWMEIPIAVWPKPDQQTRIRLRKLDDIRDEEIEEIAFEPTDQYLHEVETFSKAVRGDIEQPWPIENAISGMKILDALRRSAVTGRKENI